MNRWINSNEEEKPVENRHYPIWIIASHSMYEFTNWGLYLDGEFYVNGRLLRDYGWVLVAWFDLPDYKEK